MTQVTNNVSRALLAFHRRIVLDQKNLTPHKQHDGSQVLLGPSTSGHMTTASTRDILSTRAKTQSMSDWLTSYTLTKKLKQKPTIQHSAKPCNTVKQRQQPLYSNRLQKAHKLFTTIF